MREPNPMNIRPLTWTVGDVRISAICEMDLDDAVMSRLIPAATKDDLLQLTWLQPDFIDSDSTVSTCPGERQKMPESSISKS